MKCVLKKMKYAKMSHKHVIYKHHYSTQAGVPNFQLLYTLEFLPQRVNLEQQHEHLVQEAAQNHLSFLMLHQTRPKITRQRKYRVRAHELQ